MNILVSGMSTMAAKPPSLRSKRIFPRIDSIEPVARELCGNVDWRPIVIGEDLSCYDAAIFQFGLCLSRITRYALSVLWAIDNFDGPISLIINDWQIEVMIHQAKLFAKYGPKQAMRKTQKWQGGKWVDWPVYPDGHGIIEPEAECIVRSAQRIVNGEIPIIGYLNPWGDPKTLAKRAKIKRFMSVCPTGAWPKPRPTDQKKKRQWIFASLGDHTLWLQDLHNLWPIKAYGHKNYGNGKLYGEDEVNAAYNASWGVPAQPYPHAGCGWWRYRMISAANCGCVYLMDEKEQAIAPDPYRISLNEVESMSNEELATLSAEQCTALIDTTPSWKKEMDRLCEFAFFTQTT